MKGEVNKSSKTSKQAHTQILYQYVHNLLDIWGTIKNVTEANSN
jgi:hypothetical protein